MRDASELHFLFISDVLNILSERVDDQSALIQHFNQAVEFFAPDVDAEARCEPWNGTTSRRDSLALRHCAAIVLLGLKTRNSAVRNETVRFDCVSQRSMD